MWGLKRQPAEALPQEAQSRERWEERYEPKGHSREKLSGNVRRQRPQAESNQQLMLFFQELALESKGLIVHVLQSIMTNQKCRY